MNYRVQPKQYLLEKFIMDYYYYTKREAIQRYRERFPQFKVKELEVEKI